jgi:16S rRNA (guanine527-N7)-methyltransferase
VSRADEVLSEGARGILGRPLAGSELDSFQKYLELIVKWQRVQRLVGSTDPVWIVESLFLDSLLFLRILPPDIRSIADLGSGAGVPGIPIKIVRPELEVTLIESRERRASFLSNVVRELGLQGVQVANARAEDVSAGAFPGFGAVVMRCAGGPGRVLPIAKKITSPGGMVVVSGPPTPTDLPSGEWVEVPGVRAGSTRKFAIVRV